MNHHDSVFSSFFVASSLFDVAGGLQSKQKTGLGYRPRVVGTATRLFIQNERGKFHTKLHNEHTLGL